MSSDREADKFIREHHKVHPGTVQTANSLRGAALVQGHTTVVRLRERMPQLAITEAHPKALLKAMGVDGWQSAMQKFDLVSKAEPSEHERDALLAAVAAREGFSGRWENDLARIRGASEQDPIRFPTGPIHYWWPFS
jgi:predicted nuclease with RNAse H fold